MYTQLYTQYVNNVHKLYDIIVLLYAINLLVLLSNEDITNVCTKLPFIHKMHNIKWNIMNGEN